MPAREFKVSAYVDERTYRRLQRLAEAQDRSHSYMLKVALRRLLECHDCTIDTLRDAAA